MERPGPAAHSYEAAPSLAGQFVLNILELECIAALQWQLDHLHGCHEAHSLVYQGGWGAVRGDGHPECWVLGSAWSHARRGQQCSDGACPHIVATILGTLSCLLSWLLHALSQSASPTKRACSRSLCRLLLCHSPPESQLNSHAITILDVSLFCNSISVKHRRSQQAPARARTFGGLAAPAHRLHVITVYHTQQTCCG